MKAIVYDRYGPPDVLTLQDVDKPAPAPGEVLLKVRAASVNPYDWHMIRGSPRFIRLMSGLRKPKRTRPGVDVAGEVESIGADVKELKPGDEVFGSCRGALAEYACAKESMIVRKPKRLTFEQAAAVPIAGLTAFQAVRKGNIRSGQAALINGASGGVGTFAVQFAKSFGAEVTAVCSTRNVEMLRSIGADRVIDYTREDFTRGAQHYDLIVDCVGNHSTPELRRILSRNGRCVMVGWSEGTSLAAALGSVLLSFFSNRITVLMAKADKADLTAIRDLMDAGKVTPVIDRRYTLNEVAEAFRYVEEGHARGKVVIAIQ